MHCVQALLLSGKFVKSCIRVCVILILASGRPVWGQEADGSEPRRLSVVTRRFGNPRPIEAQGAPATPGAVPSERAASERDILRNLWSDQKTIWTTPFRARNYHPRFIVPFALVTAGLIASDKNVGRELSDGPPGTGTNVSGSVAHIGSAPAVYGFTGLFYGLARVTHHERARETGLLALEALVNSTIVVESLKGVTERERPTTDDGHRRVDDARGRFERGGTSFPSGHAINAWTLASVMAARYPDRRLVKYGAYSLAAIASASRMTQRKHFPSDIVVGAVLGYFIGHYVVRAHSPEEQKHGRFRPLILPYWDRAGRRSGVIVQFGF